MKYTGLIWQRIAVSDNIFLSETSVSMKFGAAFIAEEVLPCQKRL
jgi:hypothetical protein